MEMEEQKHNCRYCSKDLGDLSRLYIHEKYCSRNPDFERIFSELSPPRRRTVDDLSEKYNDLFKK